MAIEEITVTAKRREGLPAFGGLSLQRFEGTGRGQFQREAAAPAGKPTPKKPFEEIIVTAKKVAASVGLGAPIFTSTANADKLKQLRGQRIWTQGSKPIPEIVVKASRADALKAASRAARFNLAGLAAFLGGALTAELMRDVSQRRLEDTFTRVMADPKPKPDTKVKTKDPDPIDEIIVRAKRPSAPTRPATWLLPTSVAVDSPDLSVFQRDIFPKPAEPKAPAAPKIEKPKVKKPGGAALTGGALLLFPTSNIRDKVSPRSKPRSTWLLGTPGQPGLRDPLTPLLTGGNTAGVPLTASSPVRSGACAPCPSRKRKNDKRKRCYRKLVKEGQYPSRDKTYKWAELDCLTGKEI